LTFANAIYAGNSPFYQDIHVQPDSPPKHSVYTQIVITYL